MFKIEPIIYDRYFTAFEEQSDKYRHNGKGLLQRYVETLAYEWDEHTVELLNNILKNVLVPDTATSNFIPYMEESLGLPVFLSDIEIRRTVVKNFFSLVNVKGTRLSYELLFKLLGFKNISMDFLTYKQGFDSRFTFDEPARVFDQGLCVMCYDYDLHLEYTGVLTLEVYEAIDKAIKFLEPINIKIKNIYVNGLTDVNRFHIDTDTGDLIFNPATSNTDIFVISSSGDLLVDSVDYSIHDGDIHIKN